MRGFSFLRLVTEGLAGHRGWEPHWRKADPKPRYDVVILGGGGHGLATAYHLAADHGVRNVAVVERGWIGGGNSGRNTTIVRSNYLFEESEALYEHALKLWEGLTQRLDYNVMFSPRGVMALAHTTSDMQVLRRHVHANRLAGIDAELLDPAQAKARCPILHVGADARHPVLGASWQGRGGNARHDAVVWGYARAASALGVDILESCEATGLQRDAAGAVCGVETTRGAIGAGRVALVAAAQSSALAGLAGLRLPIECFPLQALVSEPVKPVMPCVVMSNTIDAYMSQSDKGELVIGAGTDAYRSYSQRGGLHVTSGTLDALCELFPMLRRLRMMRSWAGTVDVTPDRSPIIGPTPVRNLWINAGWGTGGFKAIPGSGDLFADSLAKDRPHPILAPFGLDRFDAGRLIDEATAAAVAH
ncbi:MAG TPA: sarcosine oxidase subunit beta family protein [Beijerinckiaceae bacterium]